MVEVGPRDGLQYESMLVSTEVKVDLINKLARAKMPVIECTSFMPPNVVPQFADSMLISEALLRKPTTKYIVPFHCTTP